MVHEVSIDIPATAANLGPGFDCLGLALNLYNRVTLAETSSGLSVDVRGEGANIIPKDDTNLVLRAAERLFQLVGQRPAGVSLIQENQIPVGSGLGSSAAAVLGGILAANSLAGKPLGQEEVLALAAEIEGHPDNVTPALYGGLTLTVNDGTQLVVEQIPVPEMKVVVVLPEIELPTVEARAALPSLVPITDAVFNASRVGLLVRALERADYKMLRVAVQDRLHQPYRLPLIRGMAGAFQAGLSAGAAAVALSGAGPSIIAFTPDRHKAIGEEISQAFSAVGVSSRTWVLGITNRNLKWKHRMS